MLKQLLLASALGAMALPVSAQVFNGTGGGPIPDCTGCSGAANYPNPNGSLDFTFDVAGVASVSDIGVEFTADHTWIGDVQIELIAPGGSPSFILMQQIGSAVATSFGDSSNLGGTYGFQNGSATNIHTVATDAGCGTDCVVPSANSVTIGVLSAGTPTDMTAAFAGMVEGDITGTWTLRFQDGGAGDTGNVDSALLFFGQTVPVELESYSVD